MDNKRVLVTGGAGFIGSHLCKKTSVQGIMNALDLAYHVGAKVLQASTSEVYGDPLVHPQREDYWGHVNPIGVAVVMMRANVQK